MTGFGAWGMPGGGFNWNMLTNIGAGMLANSEYGPAQAFGKGYSKAMEAGLDQQKTQLLFQDYEMKRKAEEQRQKLLQELGPLISGQPQAAPTAGAGLAAGAPPAGAPPTAASPGGMEGFSNTANALGIPSQPAQSQGLAQTMPPMPQFDNARYQTLAQAAAKAEMAGQDDIANGIKIEMQRMVTQNQQQLQTGQFALSMNQEDFNRMDKNRAAGLAQNKFDWERGEEPRKRYRGYVDAEIKGRQRMGNLNMMESALKDPKVYTGEGADGWLRLRRLGNALGFSGSEGIASSEQFGALARADVLQRIGGSLGAQISNSDRKFMEDTGPNASFSKLGNQQLVEVAKRLTQREIKVGEMARAYKKEHGQLDDGFDDQVAQYAEAHPIFEGMAGAGPTTPNPTNAPNAPKSGDKVWSRDGMKVVP